MLADAHISSLGYLWSDSTVAGTVAQKCNGETKSHGKTNFNSRHNKTKFAVK